MPAGDDVAARQFFEANFALYLAGNNGESEGLFTGYFETVLEKSGGHWLLGRRLTYVDLSLFQIIEGLRYGFPKRMKRFEKKVPRVIALRDRVAKRPRLAAYLASERRIPFSQWGIWRYYKPLDA